MFKPGKREPNIVLYWTKYVIFVILLLVNQTESSSITTPECNELPHLLSKLWEKPCEPTSNTGICVFATTNIITQNKNPTWRIQNPEKNESPILRISNDIILNEGPEIQISEDVRIDYIALIPQTIHYGITEGTMVYAYGGRSWIQYFNEFNGRWQYLKAVTQEKFVVFYVRGHSMDMAAKKSGLRTLMDDYRYFGTILKCDTKPIYFYGSSFGGYSALSLATSVEVIYDAFIALAGYSNIEDEPYSLTCASETRIQPLTEMTGKINELLFSKKVNQCTNPFTNYHPNRKFLC